jgi:5-methylcytosine-specific restriction endonuclease McrA
VVLLGGSGSDTAEVIRRRHAFFIESVYPHIRLQAKDTQRLYDPLAKEVIWIRDGRKCKNPNCGREVTFSEGHIHHIIEHTAGGKTKLDNGILVCPECHSNRQNMQSLTQAFQDHVKKVATQNQVNGLNEFV